MHGSAALPPGPVSSAAWPSSLVPPGYPYVLYAGTGSRPLPAAKTPDLGTGSGVDLQLAAQQHVATQLLAAGNAQQMAAAQQPHLTHEAALVAAGMPASDTGSDRAFARHSRGHHHHSSEQLQLHSAGAPGAPHGSAAAQEASAGAAAAAAAEAADAAAAGPGSKQGNRRSQLDTMSQVLLSDGSGEGPSGDLRPTAQSSMTTSTGGSTGAGHTHSRAGGGSSSCLAAPSQPSSLGGAPAWYAGEALLARLVAERGSNAVQALAQLGCAHPTPAAEAGARAAAAAAAVSAQLSGDGSGEAHSGGSEGGAGPRGSWGGGRPSASTASRGSMGPPLPRAPPLTLPPAKAQHTVSSHSPAAAAHAAAHRPQSGHHHHAPSGPPPRVVPVGPAAMRGRLGEPTFTLVRSLLVAQQEAFLGQLYDLHRAATRQRRLAAELAATPAPTSAAVLAQAAIARLRAAPSSSRGTSSRKHSGSVAAPGSSGHLAGSHPSSGHRAPGWRSPTAVAAAAGSGHGVLRGVPRLLPPAGPLPLDQDDGGHALAAAHLGHHVLLMAQLPAGLRAGVVLPPGDPGPDWVGVAIRRSTPGMIRPIPARYVLRTAAGPAISAEPTVQVPSASLTQGAGGSVGGGGQAAAEPGVVVDTAASRQHQGTGQAAAAAAQEAYAVAPNGHQQQQQQRQVAPSQQPTGALGKAQPAPAAAAGVAVVPAPVALRSGEAGVGRPQVFTPSPSGADGGSRHADLQAYSRPLSWVDGAARGHPSVSIPQEPPLQQQQQQPHHEQRQQSSPGVGVMPPPRSPLPASLAALGAASLPGGSAGGLVLGLGEGPPPLNVFRPTPQFPPAEASRFLAGPVVHGAGSGFDPHSYWMKKHYGGAGPALSTPAPATAPATSGGMAGGPGAAEVVSAPVGGGGGGGGGEEGGRSASASQGGPGGAPSCWWQSPMATFGELGCVDPTAPIPVASQLEAGGALCTSSLAGGPARSNGGGRSASHLGGAPARKRARGHAAAPAPAAEGCGQSLERGAGGAWDMAPADLRAHNESAFKPLRRQGGLGRDRTKSASARHSAGGGSRMESVGSEEEPGACISRDRRPGGGGRSGVGAGGGASSHPRSHHRPPAASRSFRSGPTQTQGSARMSCVGGGAADRNAAGILMSLSSGGAPTSSS